MKFLAAPLFFVFALVSCAQSQNGSDVLQLAIKELPPCALKCTLSVVGASSCQLTEIGCIKNNNLLLEELTSCVRASCTIKESLTAKKFLAEIMGAPVRNDTALGTYTSLVVGGAAVLFFLLRVIARLPYFGGNWGLDDWVMTVAVVLIIPLTICAYILNQIGMGQDMWLVPFDNITKILEIFYYTELLYLASVALTKISILLFYLRIFPQTGLRKAIWVTIGLCVVYIITFVTATALQCIPIRLAWERWDGEHHGRCINLNADAWCSAAANIVLDLIVIILPMKEIKKLAISKRRKAGVMFMFLGGLFITVVSILRLKYLVQFAHTDNVTWDYLPIGYWSAVESHVGVMVAALPAIRSLQRSISDRLFPKPVTATSYYEDETKNSSRKASRKDSHSHILSSLARSHIDKEDFMRLDEYEMKIGADMKDGPSSVNSPTLSHFERSLGRHFRPDDDVAPLAFAWAPMSEPIDQQRGHSMNPSMGGIMVQSEFSVNSGSHIGQAISRTDSEELTDKIRCRI
ncbi:hypothetical protein HBH71_038790 [Parastagonospora nodorum]|nr:hypothetical protein HBH71_038790 [Parastagonospora nodorum]KAH5482375.1 hypothetical protein HBI28_005470 [Parastagonospora nodorum]KAH5648446.1 hypothetical protein HBI22_017990 [Parastagonospora nodorum]